MATVAGEDVVRLWDLEKDNNFSLGGALEQINCLSYSPSKRILAGNCLSYSPSKRILAGNCLSYSPSKRILAGKVMLVTVLVNGF